MKAGRVESTQAICEKIVQRCDECRYWRNSIAESGNCYVLPRPIGRRSCDISCMYGKA